MSAWKSAMNTNIAPSIYKYKLSHFVVSDIEDQTKVVLFHTTHNIAKKLA